MDNVTELFGGRCKIYQGHVLETLRQIPDNSVHCCVTSPPYWGLRAYSTKHQIWGGDGSCNHDWQSFIRAGTTGGIESAKVQIKGQDNFQIVPDSEQAMCSICGAWRGELGLEPSPDCLGWATGKPCGVCFVCHIVHIYREVKRVLRDDGTCFLNLGDSYATSNPVGRRDTGEGELRQGRATPVGSFTINTRKWRAGAWAKGEVDERSQRNRNGVGAVDGLKQKDLCGIPWRVALALQADGWYLRSDIIWHKNNPMPESVSDRPTRAHEYLFLLSKSPIYYYDGMAVAEQAVTGGGATRNKRTVWNINTKPYRGAHFATYPPKLVEPCVKSGSSEKGVCPKCGAPWTRIVGNGFTAHDGITKSDYKKGSTAKRLALLRQAARERGEEYSSTKKTLGWKPSCDCNAGDPVPATVLDIFHGSGTTSVVALNHGRNAIGCELNPEYVQLSIARIEKEVTGQLELGV